MATSGTFTYNPALADIVVNAFGRIQIRRTELLPEHLSDAATEANLLLTEWSNRQVNLWTVTAVSVPLVAATALYTLPANTVTILVAYLSTIDASGFVTDRVISPVSTTEYASYPNKTQSGPPTVVWLNRQIVPQVTVWPVPDSTQTYTLNMQVVRQIQDAAIPGAKTLEVPYRWIDAFTAGLAARLSQMYKPAMAERMDARYERAWTLAASQDVEDVPLYITGDTSGYYS